MLSSKAKRYLHSTAITFITGFLLVFLPLLDTSLASGGIAKDVLVSALLAGVFAGLRATIKVVYEYLTIK